MSLSHREKIGKLSSDRFNDPVWLAKHRSIMENNGHWIPIHKKDDYLFYRDLSNWKYNVMQYDIEGKELLSIHGIYNGASNTVGLVRDHKFSRYNGFIGAIFPELIRHPVNCQLILHADNIRKCRRNSISIDELFDKIRSFSYEYEEQQLCIELIESYKNGKIYLKENYYEQF